MPRYRHILAATDFSRNAARALDWAIMLAREQGSVITLLHVLEKIPASKPPGEIRADLLSDLQAVERIVADARVEVTSLYRPGRAWEAVSEVQDEIGADLVVLVARGHSTLASLIVGSTADRVVRSARVPVVTVPAERGGAKQAAPRVVVVAADFSAAASVAMDAAVGVMEASADPVGFVLVHAWQPLVQYEMDATVGVTVNPLDDTRERAGEQLEAIASPLRERGLEVATVVRQGGAAGVIRREAETRGACLIAVGTSGRSGFEHFMLGSVAERLLHYAPCPVLTARAG